MTDITPLIKSNQMVVQSYGPAGFKISGQIYDGHVIVFPDHVELWDGVSFESLKARKALLDVVLYGTGATMKILTKKDRPEGLPLEAMNTGAACRTYNALMADGRRVAAALVRP